MNLNLYMYATKLFEMCRCSINTNFQNRCDQGLKLNMCDMRADTAIYLFKNTFNYFHNLPSNTYRQKGIALYKYMSIELKVRSISIKNKIVDEFILKLYSNDLDKFIQDILNSKEEINNIREEITRPYFNKFLKKHSFSKQIKQIIKFSCGGSIEYWTEKLWNNNEDIFKPKRDDEHE